MATLRDRYGKAKEIAGQSAVNKASLANKMAKQAAAMSNNSKMTQALLGAQAANDAVAQGFDEGIDRANSMQAQISAEEARVADREQSQKQFEAQQAQAAAEAEKNRQQQAAEAEKQRQQQAAEAEKQREFEKEQAEKERQAAAEEKKKDRAHSIANAILQTSMNWFRQ